MNQTEALSFADCWGLMFSYESEDESHTWRRDDPRSRLSCGVVLRRTRRMDTYLPSPNCPSCHSVAIFALAPSGKSAAHFRTSLLPHEGRVATVTRRWQWDAMGVCRRSVSFFARTNGDARTVKSRGPDIPMLMSTHVEASLRVRMVANKPGAPGRTRSSR
jgi:hypothetical protein